MGAAFTLLCFTLDRFRVVLLTLALIVLLKAAWVMLAPVLGI